MPALLPAPCGTRLPIKECNEIPNAILAELRGACVENSRLTIVQGVQKPRSSRRRFTLLTIRDNFAGLLVAQWGTAHQRRQSGVLPKPVKVVEMNTCRGKSMGAKLNFAPRASQWWPGEVR